MKTTACGRITLARQEPPETEKYLSPRSGLVQLKVGCFGAIANNALYPQPVRCQGIDRIRLTVNDIAVFRAATE